MITLGLALGAAALLAALVPLPPVTQVLAALLGAAAVVVGAIGRGSARKRGGGTSVYHATIALGALAILTSGVVFASCAACSGAEHEGNVSKEFRKEAKKILE
ncbi:MAG: hypothetical protein KC503_35080 [Myxococcales bacterium]|nr:hypothetical protein [Myxococcales bacterium]